MHAKWIPWIQDLNFEFGYFLLVFEDTFEWRHDWGGAKTQCGVLDLNLNAHWSSMYEHKITELTQMIVRKDYKWSTATVAGLQCFSGVVHDQWMCSTPAGGNAKNLPRKINCGLLAPRLKHDENVVALLPAETLCSAHPTKKGVLEVAVALWAAGEFTANKMISVKVQPPLHIVAQQGCLAG